MATTEMCAQEVARCRFPRLESTRMQLEHGAEYVEQQGEERDEDKRNVVAFVNRVNTLALQLTQLPDFEERRKGCSWYLLLLDTRERTPVLYRCRLFFHLFTSCLL